ncbi:MAG TPA: glutathione synthase [Myxococcota bacterium]
MVVRHLFVIDPVTSLHPAGDTSVAFMRAAARRGDEVWVCEPKDIAAPVAVDKGSAFALATKLTVHLDGAAERNAPQRWYDAAVDVDVNFDEFACIWMRKDPPVDEVFLVTCALLERHDPRKTVVLNDPRSLRIAHEKLWALQFPELVPPQVVTSRRDVLKAFVEEHGTAVLKPLAFMGGMGVMVFDKDDHNLKSAIDLLTAEGRKQALAQAYLKDVRVGDKRVIVVDGEPVAGLLRVPMKDDVRANLHVGGTATQVGVDDNDRRICERIGPELRRLGLFFVGLDVIGGRLTEVNVTSPTGVADIDRLEGRTGDNAIAHIVVERAVQKHAKQAAGLAALQQG